MEEFEGSRIVWITPHHVSTKRVKIHDLTPHQLTLIRSENENYQVAKEQAALLNSKEEPHTPPLWTIKRTGTWKDRFVYEGDVPSSSQAVRGNGDEDEDCYDYDNGL